MRQTGQVRYLTIVRHAKAEKPTSEKSDFDRVLSERGRHQCEQLRAWASDGDELGRFGPTAALVSAAARTKETFQRAFEGTPFVTRCSFSELIYNGQRDVSGDELLIELAAVDLATTSLLVVGHNPTVLEFLWSLSSEPPMSPREGFPTGAAFTLAIPDDRPVGLAKYDVVAAYVPD
jgi:phosphohistidine phosphatase